MWLQSANVRSSGQNRRCGVTVLIPDVADGWPARTSGMLFAFSFASEGELLAADQDDCSAPQACSERLKSLVKNPKQHSSRHSKSDPHSRDGGCHHRRSSIKNSWLTSANARASIPYA